MVKFPCEQSGKLTSIDLALLQSLQLRPLMAVSCEGTGIQDS